MPVNPRAALPEQKLPHRLTLDERSRLEVTGVTEVIRFDEQSVVLKTACGLLILRGESLKLLTLTPEDGRVRVDGSLSALSYERLRQRGFWRRLFA